MIVGILNRKPLAGFVKKYIAILEHNKIETVLLDINSGSFWEDLKKIDVFIFRWSHNDSDKQLAHTILPIIENEMGITCFPNQKTSWHYDDKIRQYYLLKSKGFPITESFVFWDKQSALDWSETAELPIVFKMKAGAGSTNVVLIKSHSEMKSLIHRMFGTGFKTGRISSSNNVKIKDFSLLKETKEFLSRIKRRIDGRYRIDSWQTEKNYILFQKFLPKNDFDTRVTVIGGRAFAFRRFNRDGDFRSSGSGKIDYDMNAIDRRMIRLALDVSKAMGFQSMAYDMLINENSEPEFCEISYTYQDRAVYNCPGYWDENLEWHKGHFWPQYWQLTDLLNIVLNRLKKR